VLLTPLPIDDESLPERKPSQTGVQTHCLDAYSRFHKPYNFSKYCRSIWHTYCAALQMHVNADYLDVSDKSEISGRYYYYTWDIHSLILW